MTASTLTKRQRKHFGPRAIDYYGQPMKITAAVRFDDECGNGHNTFSITGEIINPKRRGDQIESCGCLHEQIAAHFPELAPLIKWHLCSSDGPMHYIANTLYHVLEHGPTHAWVYFTGPSDPLGVGDAGERLVGYVKTDEAKKVEGADGYRVEWDNKTIKTRNLDHARSSAAWPEATDEELTAPGLHERLEARLPALMVEFQHAVESLGFTW